MSSNILLIPGPIVISENVQAALGTPSLSHTGPEFAAIFCSTLQKTRKLFKAGETAQPVLLAGSGTLGWDVAASNLIIPGERVLVLSTGYFSDSFAECFQTYGAKVDKLTAPLGGQVPVSDVREALANGHYKMISITHVDTSTAVLNDVRSICRVVKEVSPETLITVDCVCSVGCEKLEFDAWGIDYALTASQKAIGCAPGLSISMLSERAVGVALNREAQSSFFASLKRWIPIMQSYEKGSAAYFATPAVQLINALDVAIGEVLKPGLDARIAKHRDISNWFKSKVTEELGLKLVSANERVSAHGLTAIYVKNPPEVISALKKSGIVIAGGIHKDIKGEYIRVGHMGESACNDSLQHIQKCYDALKSLNL
ncbi:LANO_0D10154g1_1 [Lachancea nothofagi CBS 11611]|uniref:alanine--glyoxylate transaminase n=1 Tax=Lachancea nothofagi CBS 11611 TaxID=1266666 RepID=A0A1G4JK07_9SACH|nr:LANO_0D10154g1_1 [Lachancea nothofagi CBS 11611]